MSAPAPLAEQELFDPEFLDRLRALFFKLRKRRRMRRRGEQATPATGFTREFKDHRHYAPGDDYRAIDWRLYARLDRLFVRLFEEVQEFHVHVLLDRSLSLAEPWPAKRLAALRLGVALSYLGLMHGHRVSLLTLGEEVRRELPPLKGQGHIRQVLRHLAALPFGGRTDLVGCVRRFRPGRDRRGIVFLVSDLFGRDVAEASAALALARQWPAETHVIQVLDPGEREPELEGECRLQEVETGEVRRMWLTRRDLARYRAAFAAFLEEVGRTCARQQLNYLSWSTAAPFEEQFLRLLMRGSALAGG